MLTLQNITKIYGDRLALNNVSLHITRASFTLVFGSNGAGKSTLLRIMARLAEPSEGSASMDPSLKASLLGHSTFLYPALTALDNLAFHARLHKMPADSAALMHALSLVRLAPHAHELARHLSRGMAQRLNFARILMLSPDIYLLDEPFSGMDRESARSLAEELARRKRDGAAIVMISHSPETDLPLATDVHELENGRLVFSGKPGEYERRMRASC